MINRLGLNFRVFAHVVATAAVVICFGNPCLCQEFSNLEKRVGKNTSSDKPQDEAKESGQSRELKTLKEKASYLVGFDIGENILRRELDVDYEILTRGFLDALNKKTPPLSKTEIESVMKAFEKQVQEQADAKWKKLARTNLEKATAFLIKNKLEKGVIQTESGLQFKVLSEGEGDKLRLGSRVKIHVIGKHLDGTEFDNTYMAKEPIAVTVGGNIRGLDEALKRMRAGEKWKVFIPSDLAFRERGLPPDIGPNELLIYEVEIVEIIKK